MSKTSGSKEKPIPKAPRATLWIGDSTEMNLLAGPAETWQKMGRIWSKPTARASDHDASYRFINYLDQSGLLKDHRAETGVGWRAFSFVDCVYLELVVALRKMGVKSDTIRYLYNTFSEPYIEGETTCLTLDWLIILICVHAGTEMELIIDSDNSKPRILDPVTMVVAGVTPTEGQMRVSLSVMVNNVRERFGMKPVKIRRAIGISPLNDAETEAVMSMKSLESEDEEIRIRKTSKGRVLVDKKKVEPKDSELAKDLKQVMAKHGIEDFTDIALAVRQGGIANIRVSTSDIYDE